MEHSRRRPICGGMSKFQITREWLAEQLTVAGAASQVTMPGDEMRAILRAAWKGMGYAGPPAEVFEFVPAQNPNWIRFFEDQDKKRTDATRRSLRVVEGDKPGD